MNVYIYHVALRWSNSCGPYPQRRQPEVVELYAYGVYLARSISELYASAFELFSLEAREKCFITSLLELPIGNVGFGFSINFPHGAGGHEALNLSWHRLTKEKYDQLIDQTEGKANPNRRLEL